MPRDMHQKAAEHHEQTKKPIGLPRSSTEVTIMRVQSSNQLKQLISPKQLTNIRPRLTTRASSRSNLMATQQVAPTGPRVGAALFCSNCSLFWFGARCACVEGPARHPYARSAAISALHRYSSTTRRPSSVDHFGGTGALKNHRELDRCP